MKLKTVLELASQHKCSDWKIKKFKKDNKVKPIKKVGNTYYYNSKDFDTVKENKRYIEKVVYITENFFIFESKMN